MPLNLNKTSTGKAMVNDENLQKIDTALGSGLCLAKFTQMTLHLGTGMVHSCHHPKMHKIPLDELAKDPGAFFNTITLKAARKEMLCGTKTAECDYCWRIEKDGNKSDRHYKSLEDWANPVYDSVKNNTGDERINPTYLEVSFSNACNFSCLYCGPEFSSKWMEDLKKNGPIKLLEGTDFEQWQQGYQDLDNLVIPNREHNPYIEAFWKWFPEIYNGLKHYRITGGEPLMSRETFRSIDWFIDNPNPDLEFSINTNLGVPDVLWDKFIEKISRLANEKKVKKVTIFTSLESWGESAEYVRRGLDFKQLQNRVEQILNLGNIRCVIMSAFNLFSITTFKHYLSWVLNLKKTYNRNGSFDHFMNLIENTGFGSPIVDDTYAFSLGIDIPYLRHPTFMDVHYCDDEMVEKYLLPALKFMLDNTSNSHMGFEVAETNKFKRIVSHRVNFNKKSATRDDDKDIILNRAKFFEYINQLDKRQGSNFLETFPEMTGYYELCMRDWQRLLGR